MAARRTLAQLTTKVRQNLDEAAPGFWTAANVSEAINAAKDRVWQEVRKAAQDFFVVTRSSTDGSVSILGDAYDTSGFALAAGVRDYTLPPDCVELRTIECLTSGYESVRFHWRPASDPTFRALLAQTDQREPEGFLYTVLGERTWRVVPLSNRTLDVRLTYGAQPGDLSAASDTLEMPPPLGRAVEEYATADCLMADRAPEAAAWEARGNATVARWLASVERASTEPEYVVGYLEGEY